MESIRAGSGRGLAALAAQEGGGADGHGDPRAGGWNLAGVEALARVLVGGAEEEDPGGPGGSGGRTDLGLEPAEASSAADGEAEPQEAVHGRVRGVSEAAIGGDHAAGAVARAHHHLAWVLPWIAGAD